MHTNPAPRSGVHISSMVGDERQLIESCRLGNRDAQRQLYERHCAQMYRLMYRMVGESNADDLTQQVFYCLFQRLDKFEARSSFSTWLYRLASNEALQFLRRRPQRVPDRVMVSEPMDDRISATERTEQRDLLEYALAQLHPDLRVIFLLRESEELSYYDIAMTLDIAEGTVASRLNRARRCLRELIETASE